eukprot:764152-Hanusia_phi.AAC.1
MLSSTLSHRQQLAASSNRPSLPLSSPSSTQSSSTSSRCMTTSAVMALVHACLLMGEAGTVTTLYCKQDQLNLQVRERSTRRGSDHDLGSEWLAAAGQSRCSHRTRQFTCSLNLINV